MLLYSNRADMNKEYYQTRRFFNTLNKIVIIVFTMDKDLLNEDEEEGLTLV